MAGISNDPNTGIGLADGGADTIVIGAGWTITDVTPCTADIQTFSDDLGKDDVPIVSGRTAVESSAGALILQAHEAIYLPENQCTILSSNQMREHGAQVNDCSAKCGGTQNIIVSGHEIPLQCKDGLLTVPVHKPTDEELLT